MVTINERTKTVRIKGLVLVKDIPYYQKSVPADLQPRLGKSLVKVPLDKSKALHQQCKQLDIKWSALFKGMRSDSTLNHSEQKLAAMSLMALAGIDTTTDNVEMSFVREDGREETFTPAVDRLQEYLEDRDFRPSKTTAAAFRLLKLQNAQQTPMLLSEAFEVYLENHSKGHLEAWATEQRKHWNRLLGMFGDIAVEGLTRAHAKSYRDKRLEAGVKTTSVAREVNSIRAVLNKAIREHSLKVSNPFVSLTIQGKGEDSIKRLPLTTEQLSIVLEGVTTRAATTKRVKDLELNAVIGLLALTGMRLSEALGLRTSDIDFEKATVSVTPHKLRGLKTKDSERVIPLMLLALTLLKDITATKSKNLNTLVFGSLWGKDITSTSNTVSASIRIRLKAMGVPLSAHCFRHTLRDRLRAVEAPEAVAKQLGGWASSGDISAGYGRGYPVEVLSKWLSTAYPATLSMAQLNQRSASA